MEILTTYQYFIMYRAILSRQFDQVGAALALPGPQVFVAYVGDEAKDQAVKLAGMMRRAGIGIIGTVGSRSLKAQLRQANSIGVTHTVIIGEEEIKTGTVVLRNMATSEQETVPVTQLAERLPAASG